MPVKAAIAVNPLIIAYDLPMCIWISEMRLPLLLSRLSALAQFSDTLAEL